MARRLLLVGLSLFLLPLAAGAAPTADNDDSCDVAVMPAATLLLPFFEVDLEPGAVRTTRFSITNVTNADRIAHVTLWTDRAFPVIDFSVYLTGYDVQVIDLFDVIVRGIIAPPSGTGTAIGRRGTYSRVNTELDLSSCDRLPGLLPPEYVLRMREAFTLGRVPALGGQPACDEVGGQHTRAIGYATIDVVRACTTNGPANVEYWTRELRYDNVLIGDYEVVEGNGTLAQGGPLVHIRAIPEGGTPELRRAAPVTFDAGFERTFYSRHQPADAPRLDGRQPLPSQFAPRWIQGGPAGFRTALKIWREGGVRADAPCSAFAANDELSFEDMVRFDENENAAGAVPASRPVIPTTPPGLLSATSITSVTDASVYPQLTNAATSGWIALNLDTSRYDPEVTQNWVISSMAALGRFSTDVEAPALGNGCSPQARLSNVSSPGGAPIGPAPNVNRGGRTGQASTRNDDSCDIALLPAATLLVPFFQVDPDPRREITTLLSVTNVTPEERIARVTLWTDLSVPVLTFNVFLTGYDVQSIDLYDVIVRGVIAPENGTGTAVSPRGRWSTRNADLQLGACERLPGALGPEWTAWMLNIFQEGRAPDFGSREACDEVGLVHTRAVGYATIDVVRNCSSVGPADPSYWSRDIAFDNVLIGDYQTDDNFHGSATGAPMVHVRAIPEGGGKSAFARTFYSRHARGGIDARQPLPSTFAATWTIENSGTLMEIWREGLTSGGTSCGHHRSNAMTFEIVRFDDRENAVGKLEAGRLTGLPWTPPELPVTSRSHVQDASVYPFLTNGATSGWMYFNLDVAGDELASQAWVVATRRSLAGHDSRRDAAALGNGCSRPVPQSEAAGGTAVIGPAPNRRLP